MSNWTGPQTTFEDAWQLWAEVESVYGCLVTVAVHRPQTLKNGNVYHARVSVTTVRREGGKDRYRTEYCQIGGARGARTVPAALIRALTELAARLGEAEEDAAQRAAF